MASESIRVTTKRPGAHLLSHLRVRKYRHKEPVLERPKSKTVDRELDRKQWVDLGRGTQGNSIVQLPAEDVSRHGLLDVRKRAFGRI
jgi:hypothetical protein